MLVAFAVTCLFQEDIQNNTFIANLSAIDSDTGTAGHSQVTFILVNNSVSFRFYLQRLDDYNYQLRTAVPGPFPRQNFALSAIVLNTQKPSLNCSIIINVNTLEPEYFDFSVTGNSYLQGSVAQVAQGMEYIQSLGFLLPSGRNPRQVVASLGSQSQSKDILLAEQPVVHTRGVLLEKNVRSGAQPAVTAILQLYTRYFSDYIESSTVRLQVTAYGSGSQTPSVGSAPCTVTSSRSWCRTAALLPTTWFVQGSPYTTASVSVVDMAPSPRAPVDLGNVTLHPAPMYTHPDKSIVALLPQKTITPGEVIAIDLYSRAGNDNLNAYDVSLSFNVPVAQMAFNPIATLQDRLSDWQCSQSMSSFSGTTFAASCKVPVTAAQRTISKSEALIRVTFTYTGTAGVTLVVNGTVSTLSTFRAGNVLVGSQPLNLVDRSGLNSTAGSIFTYNSSPTVLAVFPVASSGELVNEAVITNRPGTTVLLIRSATQDLLWSTKQQLPIATNMACSSSNITVADVDATCVAINLDGIVQIDPGFATITATHTSTGVASDITIAVWTPSIPLTVQLSDATLSPITNWMRNDTCNSLQYQAARISVLATLLPPDQSSPVTDLHILKKLQPTQLVVEDGVVAHVRDTFLFGLSPGNSNLTIVRMYQGNPEIIGEASFVVEGPTKAVNATLLRLSVFTGLDLALDSNSLASASAVTNARVNIQEDFFEEDQTGYLAASVVFDDGSIYQLDVGNVGFNLTSLNTEVARVVSPDTFTVHSSGTGNFLRMQWTPSQCPGQGVLISGLAELAFRLPEPTSISVTQVPNTLRLAVLNGSASAAGIPTKIDLTVMLIFPRSQRDMTLDSRTIYNTSESNGVFHIIRSASSVVLQSTSKVGTGNLTISFRHYARKTTIAISVVEADHLSLRISPWPTYVGSDTDDASSLDFIASSGVQQEGRLWTQMHFTDQAVMDISDLPLLQYNIVDGGSFASISKRSMVDVVTPSSSNLFGSLNISATFDSRVSAREDLVVSVTNDTLPITTISQVFVATSAAFTVSTFHGLAGTATADANADFVLSDGTRYLRVLSTPSFIGLVNITSSQPSSVSINPTTGKMLLQTNYHTSIAITASAEFDGVAAVPATVSIFANLDADIGDVDIGAALGPPIPPVASGAVFSFPLTINSGRLALGAVTLELFYDETEVEILSTVDTPPLVSSLRSPRGRVTTNGALTATPAGSRVLISTLTFRAMKDVLTSFSVHISLIGEQGTTNLIGNFKNLNSVASSVDVLIGSPLAGRRRRAVHLDVNTPEVPLHRHRRQSSGFIRGDVNEDGAFNAIDIDFAQQYTADVGAKRARPVSTQVLQELDANGDGKIDAADSLFMNKVQLQFAWYLSGVGVSILPVSSPGCNLNINVTLFNGNPSEVFRTDYSFIYVLIGHSNAAAQDMVRATTFTSGYATQVISANNRNTQTNKNAFYGGIWEAVPIRGLEANGLAHFTINAYTALSLRDISVSVLQMSTDNLYVTSPLRREVSLRNVTNIPFEYNQVENVVLSTGRTLPTGTASPTTTFNVGSSGFNPLQTFSNPLRSDLCNFGVQDYEVLVSEDHSVNSSVFIINATSLPYPAGEQYTITFSSGDDTFALRSSASGDIELRSELDREETDRYALAVSISQTSAGQTWSGTANIIINVTDVNDNSPEFVEGNNYTVVVSEGVTVPSLLIDLNATDNDTSSNQAIAYSIVTGDTSTFSIDLLTGEISVSESLDRESTPGYMLVVEAKDGGTPARSALATVHVIVADVNDNAPRFNEETYKSTVPEDFPVGRILPFITIAITDADLGSNGNVTRAFVSQNSYNDTFGIIVMYADGSVTAQIVVRKPLDREAVPVYTFDITAIDGGSPAISSTATVIINVTDVNDNHPIFTSLAYSFHIQEDLPIGSFVGFVLAQDADEGSNSLVRYSVLSTSPSPSPFLLNSETGELSTVSMLSRSIATTYSLQIAATDRGIPQLNGTSSVSVLLLQPEVVTFQLANKGFALGSQPTRVSENVYTQEIGLFANGPLSTAASLSATYGTIRTQQVPLATALEPCTSIQANILQQIIEYDTRSVTVILQLADDRYSSRCQASVVKVAVSPSPELMAIQQWSGSKSCNPEIGQCRIHFDGIPRTWFRGDIDVVGY